MKRKKTFLVLAAIAVVLLMISTVTARPVVEDSATRNIITDSVYTGTSDELTGMAESLTGEQTDAEYLETLNQLVNQVNAMLDDPQVIEFFNSDEVKALFLSIDYIEIAESLPEEELLDMQISDELKNFVVNLDVYEEIMESYSTSLRGFFEILEDLVVCIIASIAAILMVINCLSILLLPPAMINYLVEVFNYYKNGDISLLEMLFVDAVMIFCSVMAIIYLYPEVFRQAKDQIQFIIQLWQEFFDRHFSSQILQEVTATKTTI